MSLKKDKCEKIWTGKFKDDIGTFEILVPACNREEATITIKNCLNKIKNGQIRVTQKLAGEPDLIYIDEVEYCGYIREYSHLL